MEKSKVRGLSGGTLKILALVTMIIDHATYEFIDYTGQHQLWLAGRRIGRLAFPIYCFLIVEGFHHTRNVKKYAMRLFLFAFISEIPFDLAFKGTVFDPARQNVFFTLFLGVVLMYLVQKSREIAAVNQKFVTTLLLAVSYVAVCLAAYFMKSDYGINGIVLIFLMYTFHGKKASIAIIDVMMNLLMGLDGGIQTYGGLSAIPISLYNGKKGVSLKYFFYVIYPLHLLILYYLGRSLL